LGINRLNRPKVFSIIGFCQEEYGSQKKVLTFNSLRLTFSTPCILLIGFANYIIP